MTVIFFNSVLIVLLLGFIIYQVRNIWDANNFIHIEIKKVLNDIRQKLDDFNDDVIDDLRDKRILDKLKELDKPPFNTPMNLPCYHPDGICTNPQMDCINCPKRGTGGTWSTSTNLNK